MAKNITALYINDASIRLLVTKGKRISKIGNVPLESGFSDIVTREQEQELAEKVANLFKSNKISNKKVIVGLSGLHCLTRPVMLPELPKAMLDEAIIREAKRVLPVPPEQLYISWQIVKSIEGKLSAFMVAIPRQTADMLMRILHGAGLKPYCMDIKPLALARLSKEATSVIVDVQAKEFDIIIMVQGMPQPIRTVPFPEDTTSINEKLAIVNDELLRTIQFYNTNNPDTPLPPETKILVSGEIADEPELYEYLGQQAGYPIAPLESPLKTIKNIDPSHHLANVGLMLKEMPAEAGPLLPNFNTMPEPYLPRQISLNKLMAVPAAVVAVALVALLAMTIQDAGSRFEASQIQLDTTKLLLEKRQAQKAELTGQIAALEGQLVTIQNQREDYTKTLNTINERGYVLESDIDTSVISLIDGIDFNAITHVSEAMAIDGSSISEEELIDYVRELTETGKFSEITISNIRRVNLSSDNVTFNLSFRLQEQ